MKRLAVVVCVIALAVGIASLVPSLRRNAAGVRTTAATRAAAPALRRPPLSQPSARHPLTVLEIGDSLGEDLGFGLAQLLAGHRDVRLFTKAVGDTGLANVAYYNWPATFRSELAALHPGLVVIFIGGNDHQGFDVNGRPALFGTPFWHQQYAARVATMMAEAKAAGAQVLWVGMPIMASPSFSAAMHQLNAIYRAEAARFANVHYFSTWKLFSTPQGQYAQDLPVGPHGALVEVRDPDGVHIAPPAGNDLIAGAVLRQIHADWSIHL